MKLWDKFRVFIHSNKRIFWGSVFFSISIVIILIYSSIKVKSNVDHELLKNNLNEINSICNNTISDIQGSEEKYLTLLEKEEDFLKRGTYHSALILINTVKGDYDKVVENGELAVENYLKVENGEYYAIAEYKYLAWSMLRGGRFGDSFNISSKLLEMVDTVPKGVLFESEILEIEALVYSIFINIFSEFEMENKAKMYYEKLNEIHLTEDMEYSVGDKVYYSKIMYAQAIKDYELMKKSAEECYFLMERLDEKKGIDTKHSVVINIAEGNLRVGNLAEAYKQLKHSEEYFIKIKDVNTLGTTYNLYGEYYKELGDIETALEYYKKSIQIYIQVEDHYRILNNARQIIDLMESNGINEGIDEYYTLYYFSKEKSDNDGNNNKLLAESININNQLNESVVKYLKKRGISKSFTNLILITMIIMLVVLIKETNKIIKRKKNQEKKLTEIVNEDYLTGVNSKRQGYNIIKGLINKKQKFSIGILDIDNFKDINDIHGHIYGDYILTTMAGVLKRSLPENNHIIRFGGEEFLILFENNSKECSETLLNFAKDKIKNIEFRKNVEITFSAGICDYNGEEIEEVIEKVDKLLYKAKIQGKNRIITKS